MHYVLNNSDLVIHRQVKTSDIISRRFGNFMTPLSRVQMRVKLAFVNFTLICTLDNGVMKSPKRGEIILLVFTCLCIMFCFNLSYASINVMPEGGGGGYLDICGAFDFSEELLVKIPVLQTLVIFKRGNSDMNFRHSDINELNYSNNNNNIIIIIIIIIIIL